MRNINEETITQAVLESMAGCSNPRLYSVMTSLVQHLHAFAREVQLTEEEWFEGIRFLTRTGHITDDRRQEFILLSDVLGLSMLVTAQNNHKPAACTESTVFGPFFVEGAAEYKNGADIANGARGTPCLVECEIVGLDGSPVVNAEVDVWQSDEDGNYDVQKPNADGSCELSARGRLRSDADGCIHFRSILAHHYPIPHDGPVGALLSALGRHPWRPAHLHFMVKAEGYETLITHVFRDGDRYLDSDAVFGVRSSLIADWVKVDALAGQPNYRLSFRFVLNPQGAAA